MLRGLTIQQFFDRGKQEVHGYYELLTNVFDAWSRLRFSESLIKRFHYEMPKYAEKDEGHRGEYKRQENKVHMVDEAGQKDTQMVCNKYLYPLIFLKLGSISSKAVATQRCR